MAFDKAEWQYDSALKEYLARTGKEKAELTEEDESIIWKCAGNHIAFFLTWLIRRDLIGDMHLEEANEKADLEAVKNQQKTGMDIFEKYCDMSFTDEDVAEDVLGFVQDYYDKRFLDDYCSCISQDKILQTTFNWSEYLRVEPLIDDAYEDYLIHNCG